MPTDVSAAAATELVLALATLVAVLRGYESVATVLAVASTLGRP